MTAEAIRDLYEKNEAFRDYVKKCMRTYGWSLEKALRNGIVKSYADYIIETKKGKI